MSTKSAAEKIESTAVKASEAFWSNPKGNCAKIKTGCWDKVCGKGGKKESSEDHLRKFQKDTNDAIRAVMMSKQFKGTMEESNIPKMDLKLSDSSYKSYFEFDLKLNITKYNIAVSEQEGYLALWNSDEIYIWMVVNNQLLPKAEMCPYKGIKKIKAHRGVSFFPHEEGILVITDTSVTALSMEGKKQFEYEKIDLKGEINHINYAGIEEEEEKMADAYTDIYPRMVFVNVGAPSRRTYRFKIPDIGKVIGMSDSDDSDEDSEEEQEYATILHKDYFEVPGRAEKHRMYYSDALGGFWAMSLEESGLKVGFYQIVSEDDEEDSEDQMIRKTESIYQTTQSYQIHKELFNKCEPEVGGVLFASDPIGKIYLMNFSIKEGCDFKEIIILPPKVKRINQITSADNFKFVLVNSDDGELYIWARLRDHSYGLIYYDSLESDSTKLYVTGDLEYILQFTDTKVKVLDFAPYTKHNLLSADIYTGEKKFNHGDFICVPLNKTFLLKINNDHMQVMDLFTRERWYHSVLDGYTFVVPSEHEYMDVEEIIVVIDTESHKGKWIILIASTKNQVSELDIDEEEHTDNDDDEEAYFWQVFSITINLETDEDVEIKHLATMPHNAEQRLFYERDCVGLYSNSKVVVYSDLYKGGTDVVKREFLTDYENEDDNFDFINCGKQVIRWDPYPSAEKEKRFAQQMKENKENRKKQGIKVDEIGIKMRNVSKSTKALKDKLKDNDKQSPEYKPLLDSPAKAPETPGIDNIIIPPKTDDELLESPEVNRDPVDGRSADTNAELNRSLSMIDDAEKNNDDLNDSFEKVEEAFEGSGERMADEKIESLIKTVPVFIYDLNQISSQGPAKQATSQNTFQILKRLDYVLSSITGKFLLFYGAGGYELLVNVAPPGQPFKYKKIRRRVKESYRTDEQNQAVFSDCENYLAMGFTGSKKTVMFDLREYMKPKPLSGEKRTISCYHLTNCSRLNEYFLIFKFITDKKGVTKYLCITDYSESKKSNFMKYYEIDTGVMIVGGPFSHLLCPSSMDVKLNAQGKLTETTTVLVVGTGGEIYTCTRLRFLISTFNNEEQLPYQTFLRANLLKYFETSNNSQTEYFYFDLVLNIYKALTEDQILIDIRIPYSLFVLDKPGVLENAVSGRVDVNALFTTHKILHLSFDKQTPLRHHSVKAISMMFDEYVKAKKYPRIDEKVVEGILVDRNDRLINSPGCRSILSHILFADCHTIVNGLVKDKHQSLVPLKEQESKLITIPRHVIDTNIKEIMVSKPQRTQDYQVFRSKISLELTNGSLASLGLIEAIMLMPDHEIRFKYRQLINYKWKMVYWYSWIYCLIYYILNILAYYHFGYNSTLGTGFAILGLNAAFILYDMICFGAEWKVFLKDANNWLDLIVHGVSIITVVFTWINLFGPLHAYLKLAAISVISVRGISLLKMFGPLRMLVKLIGEIIVDLVWVPFILIAVLILAGTIYKVAPLPGGNANSNLTFLESLQRVFFLMFMQSQADPSEVADKTSPAGILRSIIVVLGGTMIAQGIFNFIIAIFLQTFRKVNDDKEIFEIRSLLLDIRDVDLFLRMFCRWGWTVKVKHYYLFLVPIPKDGVIIENETDFDKAAKLFDGVASELGKKGLEQIEAKASQLMPGQKKEIQGAFGALKSQAKEADPKVKALMGSVDKLAKGENLTMDELKTATTTILENSSKKGREIMTRVNKAVDIVKAQSEKWDNANDTGIDGILELVTVVAEMAAPDLKEYTEKIKKLRQLVMSMVTVMRDIKNNKPPDVPGLFKALSTAAKDLLNNDFGNSIEAISGAIGTVFEESNKMVKQGNADLVKIANATSEALAAASKVKGATGTSFQLSKEVSKVLGSVTKISARISKESLSGISDPEVLLDVGQEACKALLDGDRIKMVDPICNAGKKLLACVKTQYAAVKRQEQIDPKAVVKAAVEITGLFNKDMESIAKPFIDVVDAVEESVKTVKAGGTVSVSSIAKSIAPIMNKVIPNSDGVVNGCIGVIENIELQVKASSMEIDNIDFPKAIRTSGDLILYICKATKGGNSEDESSLKRIETAIDSSVQASVIIQSFFRESSNLKDPIPILQSAGELMKVFTPSLTDPIDKTMIVVQAVFDQVDNIQTGYNIDLESLVDDLGKVVGAINKDLSPFMEKVRLSCRTLLTGRKNFQDSQNKASAVAESAKEVVLLFAPQHKERMESMVEVVNLLETSTDANAKPNIEKIAKAGVRIAVAIDRKYESKGELAVKLAASIQAYVAKKQSSTREGVQEAIKGIAEVVSDIRPDVKPLLPGILAVVDGISKLTLSGDKRDEAVQGLIESAGAIVITVDPDLKPLVAQLQSITKSVQTLALSSKLGKLEVKLVVSEIGKVITSFNSTYGKYVNIIENIVGSIEGIAKKKAINSMEEVSVAVDSIGKLTINIDPSLKSGVDTMTTFVKAMLTQASAFAPKADKTNLDLALCFQNTKNLLISLEPSLSQTLNKVEMIINSVQKQIQSMRDTGRPDFVEILSSSKDLMLNISPHYGEAIRATHSILKFAWTMSEKVYNGSNEHSVNLTLVIKEAANLVVIADPSLKPIAEKTVQCLNAFSAHIENLGWNRDQIKASKLLTAISTITNEFAPKQKHAVDASIALFSAIEAISLGNSYSGTEAGIEIAKEVVKSLGVIRPDLKNHSDKVITFFTAAQTVLEGSKDQKKLDLVRISRCAGEILSSIDPGLSPHLEKATSCIELVQAQATASRSASSIKLSELLNMAKNLYSNSSSSDQNALERIIDTIVIAEQLNNTSINSGTLLAAATRISAISFPEYEDKIKSLTAFLEIVEKMIEKYTTGEDEDLENVMENATSLVKTFCPEQIDHVEHVMKFIEMVQELYEEANDYTALDPEELLDLCKPAILAYNSSLSGTLEIIHNLMTELIEPFEDLEEEPTPQVVIRLLTQLLDTIDKDKTERFREFLEEIQPVIESVESSELIDYEVFIYTLRALSRLASEGALSSESVEPIISVLSTFNQWNNTIKVEGEAKFKILDDDGNYVNILLDKNSNIHKISSN
jgi:hypothetical protein